MILLLLELKFVCPCRGDSEKILIKLHLRFAIVIVVRLECLAVSLTFVLLNSVGGIEDFRSASLAICAQQFFYFQTKTFKRVIYQLLMSIEGGQE